MCGQLQQKMNSRKTSREKKQHFRTHTPHPNSQQQDTQYTQLDPFSHQCVSGRLCRRTGPAARACFSCPRSRSPPRSAAPARQGVVVCERQEKRRNEDEQSNVKKTANVRVYRRQKLVSASVCTGERVTKKQNKNRHTHQGEQGLAEAEIGPATLSADAFS